MRAWRASRSRPRRRPGSIPRPLWSRLEAWPWQGASVLVVRGDGGRDWLADRLRSRGAQVRFVQAYARAMPVPTPQEQRLLREALATPQAHVWHFSSAQAIDHLERLVPRHELVARTCDRIAPAHRRTCARTGLRRRARSAADRARGGRCAATCHPTIPRTVTDDSAPPETPRAVPPAAALVPPAPSQPALRWLAVLALALAIVALAALAMAWSTQKRVQLAGARARAAAADEPGRVHRGAHARARREDAARDAAAKVALLEARVAESSLQRTQLEELIQSLSRSRDETVLGDVEAAIRVAVQQSAITGSAEPLVATLKQAEERLARYNQPRLERVRRAVTRDLERVKAVALSDISTLVIRLDEAVRQVDELPLLAAAEPRRAASPAHLRALRAGARRRAPAAASAPALERPDHAGMVRLRRSRMGGSARPRARHAHREPGGRAAAPEQSFYLRENLKLRLLNARLAVLSRQFDIAQADLRDVQAALDRYFDRSSRRVVAASELVRQVAAQARLVTRAAARRDASSARSRAGRCGPAEPRAEPPSRPSRDAHRRLACPAVRGCGGGCVHARAPTTGWSRSTGAAGGSTCR